MVCHLHLDDWSDMASFGRDGCVALHEGEGVQRAVLGADDEAGAGAGQVDHGAAVAGRIRQRFGGIGHVLERPRQFQVVERRLQLRHHCRNHQSVVLFSHFWQKAPIIGKDEYEKN